MLVQSKIQLENEDYKFIKSKYKLLNYKSFAEYVRDAVKQKIKEDRKKLREKMRREAMENIGSESYENIFESIEGEIFEAR